MLTHLSLSNFVIISQCDVAFDAGFSALTGETGAGKSILVDAVGLLMGQARSDKWIQPGHNQAVLEAIFEFSESDYLPAYLASQLDAGQLIIRRTLVRGKSGRIQINNQSVTLKVLRQIAPYLVLTIGQHSHTLLGNAYALSIVDVHIETSLLAAYNTAWQAYQTAQKDYKACQNAGETLSEQQAFLDFKINDIGQHNLVRDEDTQLLETKKQWAKQAALASLYQALADSLGQLDRMYTHLDQTLAKAPTDPDSTGLIATIHKQVSHWREPLDSLLTQVLQHSHDPPDMAIIDDAEARLDCIFKLKTKYKASTVNDLLDQLATAQVTHQHSTQQDERLAQCKKTRDAAYDTLTQCATELHTARIQEATRLSQAIESHLRALDLPQARIKLVVNTDKYTSSGNSVISIQASLNRGQPLQPVSDSASGGELSRIMLAIMCANLDQPPYPMTVIFDEIDAGIGGLTGHAVGQKLARVASHHQVICVTHLAQVAQQAQQHFFIQKTLENTAIHWQLLALSDAARKKEYNRMIGGSQTLATLLE